MHQKNYNIIFCSDIGQKHIGANTQKNIIQVLRDETPKLLYKYQWTRIIIRNKAEELMRIEYYGYQNYAPNLKTINKFLRSREWKDLWQKWSY